MKKQRKEQPEFALQKQIVSYLLIQYKRALFLSDTVGFLSMTIPQAVRNKAVQNPNFACPDLVILQPNKNYHGLFLELKAESPYKLNGELKKSEHLEKQQKSINELKELGYFAKFVWSFEQAKMEIDSYFKDI